MLRNVAIVAIIHYTSLSLTLNTLSLKHSGLNVDEIVA